VMTNGFPFCCWRASSPVSPNDCMRQS
jgi:hypothetical protein